MGKKLKLFHPDFRFKLKARIINAGYKTVAEFATVAGVHQATLNEIIGGWRVPGPTACQRLSEALEVSEEELKELLS